MISRAPALTALLVLALYALSPEDAAQAQVASTPAASPVAAAAPAPAPATAPEAPSFELAAAHPLFQRLRTLGEAPKPANGAKGAWIWADRALGAGVPSRIVGQRLPQGTLTANALPGGRLWIAGAMVRDERAVLRLGDLLPLVRELGVHDRKVALDVTAVAIAGGGTPPSYTLTFRTGALWPHRAMLKRLEAAGKIVYSLASGRVTVLGAFVYAEPQGDFSVRRFYDKPSFDEGVDRLRVKLMPRGCEPIEAALQSANPATGLAAAQKALAQPTAVQLCGARYMALARPPGAQATLRAAMRKQKVIQPIHLIEALVALDPAPSPENIGAAQALITRRGVAGAQGVCQGAPMSWTDALLAKTELSKQGRAVLERCGW